MSTTDQPMQRREMKITEDALWGEHFGWTIQLNQRELATIRRAAQILHEMDDLGASVDPDWEDGAEERTDLVFAWDFCDAIVRGSGGMGVQA